MKKYVISLSIIAAVCFYVKSVRYEYTASIVCENIEALSRSVSGLESYTVDGVTYYPQYVDSFNSDGEVTGPSHTFSTEHYPPSPVPKPGGGYYPECADLVYVEVIDNSRICYGRLLEIPAGLKH